MKLGVVTPKGKIVCPEDGSEIKICKDVRSKVGKYTQPKVDVYIEGDFAYRLEMLEAIEKRSEGNGFTAEMAYTQEWATSGIKKDLDHLEIKAEIMKGNESLYSSRSFYYLALLHRYRELVNIHYIKESNN